LTSLPAVAALNTALDQFDLFLGHSWLDGLLMKKETRKREMDEKRGEAKVKKKKKKEEERKWRETIVFVLSVCGSRDSLGDR